MTNHDCFSTKNLKSQKVPGLKSYNALFFGNYTILQAQWCRSYTIPKITKKYPKRDNFSHFLAMFLISFVLGNQILQYISQYYMKTSQTNLNCNFKNCKKQHYVILMHCLGRVAKSLKNSTDITLSLKKLHQNACKKMRKNKPKCVKKF